MTDLFDSTERAPAQTLGDEFEEFWRIYPRHEAKKKAREKFIIARRTSPLKTLVDGARRYAAHVKGYEPQYILLPSTWLHGERWEDTLIPRGDGPLRGTDALRNKLRQEMYEQGFGGPEDSADGPHGRFPRLTH